MRDFPSLLESSEHERHLAVHADHDSTTLDSQENIPLDAIESLSNWYDERDHQQAEHDLEELAFNEQSLLQRDTDG